MRHQRRPIAPLMLALAMATTVVQALAPSAAAVQTQHSAVVSDNPANWTPNVMNGRVFAILQMGSKVIVGGSFTQVQASGSAQTLTRNRLFAFDMNTGAIDQGFVPVLNGDVNALTLGPDGQSVFVGGTFTSTNGNSNYRRLVRLSLSNGQLVTGFQPNPATSVESLVLRGTWLYVAGTFQQIGGLSRSGVARVSPITGAADAAFNIPFTSPQNGGGLTVRKIDVSPDGSRLVGIGNFSQVGGQSRNQIAIINLTTNPPSLSSWQTDQFPFYIPNTTTSWCSPAFSTIMHDIDISPDGTYFVIVTTGAYRANRLCDSVSRWELSAIGPGQLPTWVDWAGGDTFWGVATTGAAIYAGGHPRWMNNPYRSNQAGPGAVPREGIAGLDPINGLPFTWDPGRARGVGTFDIVGTPDGLFVGSDTDQFGGETRRKIAFLPLAGGTVVPPNVPYGLPNDLYRIDEATSSFTRRGFDGTTLGPPTTLNTGVNWSTARGAFALAGQIYTGQSNGTLTRRSFDGTTVGGSNTINLYGLEVVPGGAFLIPGTNTPVPGFNTHLASMTGMFFDAGRIYYTVSGNPRLYYRYFTPESQVVGANLFVGSATATIDWSNVRGMTMAGGNLFYALANGNLFRVGWTGGAPTGSPVQLGGPGLDGVNWASRGLFVFTGEPESDPPTQPGTPTGSSTTSSTISLTWTASNDASLPITYRIYRDDDPQPVGSTTSTTFIDSGLAAGSTHTYVVEPVDAQSNVGPPSGSSGPITVLTAIFADDFSGGTFGNWSGVTNMSIDGADGDPAAPSARGAPTNQSAFAFRTLGGTFTSMCASVRVHITAQSTGIDLIRLRTSTDGPVIKVYSSASGVLSLRSDAVGTSLSSGVALGAGWHSVELCGTVGQATTWSLYRDGVPVVSAWAVSTGTTPIGRVQIGDNAAKTWTGNFDDVVVDDAPG